MLDFICMGSAELFGTGREQKIQNEHSGGIPRNACVACETKICVTTKKVLLSDRQTGQTPEEVIPMCRYASQATQKYMSPTGFKPTPGTPRQVNQRFRPLGHTG